MQRILIGGRFGSEYKPSDSYRNAGVRAELTLSRAELFLKSMRINTPFLFLVACVYLYGEDPKVGSTREEVVKLLGEPNGRIELKNGGSIFSFS